MPANPILTMLRAAYSVLGTPYVWGTSNPPGQAGGPGGAFDCSGLTMWLASKVGVNLPHQSTAQSQALRPLTRSELRPGDMVYFSYGRLGPGVVSHAGIYIGGGKMIDTSNPSSDLKIADMDWDNFVQGGDMYAKLGQTAVVPTAKQLNTLSRDFNAGNYVTQQSLAQQRQERRAGERGGGGGWSSEYLKHILSTYGLDVRVFSDLIRSAVVNSWSLDEFTARVYDSKEFKETFPGIFNRDGSLKMSPAEYQNMIFGPDGYQEMAREAGIKFNRGRFGRLIGLNVSPSEWAHRISIVKMARSTEPYRQSFNQVLRTMGQKDLSPSEWGRFLEGKTNKFTEKLYTAFSLNAAEGLDITAKEGLRAANVIQRELGPEAAGGIVAVDPKAIVRQIRTLGDFVGPELRAAGVTDADLAVFEAGADPKNIGTLLEQIVRNRGAISPGGTFTPAERRTRSLTGAI